MDSIWRMRVQFLRGRLSMPSATDARSLRLSIRKSKPGMHHRCSLDLTMQMRPRDRLGPDAITLYRVRIPSTALCRRHAHTNRGCPH